MSKILERTTARKLRLTGQSIKEIAYALAVSKGTVSYWCRDIALTASQIKKLETRTKTTGLSALLSALERKRANRIERTREQGVLGKKDVGRLTTRDRHMVGLGLYWGEGYKHGNEELGFTNSDPDMIIFFINWLESVFKITKNQLIARVSINSLHAHRVSKVLTFWSEKTKVPLSQFTKTSLINTASKKRYENMEDHFGTLRLKVRQGSTLRRRILGSLEELKRLR